MKLLEVAAEQVPQGIYAVSNASGTYIELKNEPMSPTRMKQARHEYRRRGLKVYMNGL